jgi:hypothetical protein
MAFKPSHAADTTETFSVETLCAPASVTVIATGLTDFLDAVDVAMEWLSQAECEQADPPAVAIFSTVGATRKQVWGYPSSAATQAAPEERRLVDLFGFDPVSWRPTVGTDDPVPGARPVRRTPPSPEPSLTVFAAAVEHEESDDRDDPAPPLPRERWVADPQRWRWFWDEIRAAWEDRVSRWCIVFGVLSLWLMVTLVEPSFLASVVAAGAGVWSRRRRHPAPAGDGVEDWF